MKKVLPLCIALFALPLFAQTTLTCSNGTSQKTQKVGNYDYELWSQDGTGSASMTIPASIGANGGTFSSTWKGTVNVLSRAGKKFTNNETVSSVGNITVEFAATWSSGDNVKMLGVYGWGYFASGTQPSGFSDQIEYYIIQDRGSYNSATSGTNCSQKGSATIDGILYNFTTCDRRNQPMLTGNGTFKQYFSYPASASSHRTSGTITVSKHFSEWAKVGMPMNKLYEVAMKVESYTGNTGTANGSANITKNILTIGGALPSSNSGGGTPTPSSSGGASSSSGAAHTQATTCKTPLITYPTNTVPADPYTACFQYTNGKCYVCKVANEQDGNTCASGWVWNGSEITSNLESGYWYQEVNCPAGSSSSAAASSSSRASSSSVASSSSRASSSSVAASSSSRASSSSTAGSSSSVVSSSSVTGGQQVCGEYQASFCGGMAFADVRGNSVTVPSVGECLFIGDFDVIQPALSSTVSINGVENICGADWDDCPYNNKPSTKDGGYYVFVKTGSLNRYHDNGWQEVVAKAKCIVAASSSSAVASSSSIASSSSSSDVQQNTSSSSEDTAEDPSSSSYYTGENTPIVKDLDPVRALHATPLQYYTLKGEPLGSNLPNKPGVYIVKEKYSVKKIVVR